MISFILLSLILLTQLILTAYIYFEINESDNFAGDSKASISKKLTLAGLVLAASFFSIIMLVYFLKFINYNRGEFLLIISAISVSILILLSYHYLDLQRRSPAAYEAAKKSLEASSVTINKTEAEIALTGGIVTLALTVVIAGLLLGKYYLSEKEIVKVKEPIYMNMQSTSLKEDYKEPDYMSEVSKNFII